MQDLVLFLTHVQASGTHIITNGVGRTILEIGKLLSEVLLLA